MKVLHIVYSGLGGGINVVKNLIHENNKKNAWIDHIILVGPKNFNVELDLKKNKIYHHKNIKHLPFLSWLKIFLKIIYFKPDIIFIHNHLLLPAILYKYFFKKKIIFVAHDSLSLFNNIKQKIINKIVSIFFDVIIVLNKDVYSHFKKINKSQKIFIIKNGIQKSKLIKKKITKSFNIGMAARMNKYKLHELMISALNTNILENKDIKCFFAGDGENYKKLNLITSKLNLNKKVNFLGNLKENKLINFYKKLDLYIQATTSEGSSISVIEAFNYGIPVLASNVSGLKDFINKKNYIGYLFKNNKYNLARSISFFFNMKKNERQKYILNQKLFFIKNNDSSIMYRKYANLLNKEIKPY